MWLPEPSTQCHCVSLSQSGQEGARRFQRFSACPLPQAATRCVKPSGGPGVVVCDGWAEGLIVRLMYGTGMRVSEALRLRIQDLGFDRNEIAVLAGKGDKDRRVPLPTSLKAELHQ